MKRLARALAVAGSAGALVGTTQHAHAAKTQSTQAKSGGLQLSILTPDPSSIVDQATLDVVCKGAVVESVELYVDNELRAKRTINTTLSRNILSFKLDTLLMSAGDHDVIVKAYSPDGKSSSSSAKLRIPALDLNAPVRIAYPQNGVQVSGTVPVRLSLDSDMVRLKPYVTFFVDKELKVLRNTPPYEFNWDTTKYSNGWHLLEAWSQDSDAAVTTKARPVNVNVNNGGGPTPFKTGVPDLRPAKANSPIKLSNEKVKDPIAPPVTSHPGGGELNVLAPGVKGGGSGGHVSTPSELDPSVQPGEHNGGPVTIGSSLGDTLHGGKSPTFGRANPRGDGGIVKRPAEHNATTTGGSTGLRNPININEPGVTITQFPSNGTGDPLAVKPADRRINTHEIHLHPGISAVAFDGTQIAFDVKPRIESGVKLAPFRQIFEHTGGKLYWFGGTAQTVRAVNTTREIEIKIGDKTAKVNNQTVEMEKKPYIETGRTIVPLTFIRDALNVKINYDEKTGQLFIESKK